MDPVLIGAISAVLVFVLILIGMHVGVALALTSVLGIYLISGKWSVAFRLLESTSYNALNDYVFAVIPLFILMGAFATVSGVMRELFESMGAALQRLRGGLGIATVAGNAVFSAITGVTVASAVVFSQVSIPEMKRLGYDKKFALGIVASSALLGMLIPPSILMVVYGVITEESIGKLFAAGMGPGLVVSLALSLAIVVMIRLRPELCGVEGKVMRAGPRLSRRQLITRPWAVYVLVLLVLGGIYAGWFTPTEAGGIGALGAFILMVLKRKFGFKTTYELLLQTGSATATIFFLLLTAQMYSRMLSLSGLPEYLTRLMIGVDVPSMAIVLFFVVIMLILGTILDSTSIMLLTMPIMVPVVLKLGYDNLWFGLVSILAIELGQLTPPCGMVIYAMKAAMPNETTIDEIFSASMPFFVVLLFALGVIIAFPQITLWLPKVMF
ncbi:MAG: TRAP transporter large permease [Burkholderiales bacterium]